MPDSRFPSVLSTASRQWGWVLAIGVLDVLTGILALSWPGATVLVLAILLGVLLLVAGVTAFSVGLRTNSGWLELLGVLAAVAAIICLVHPGAGIYAILIGCAVWFFVNGLSDLSAAFNGVSDRLFWGLLGVLSIAASVIMLASPGVAIVTVALIAGVAFLIRGCAELMLAWRLRAVHRSLAGR